MVFAGHEIIDIINANTMALGVCLFLGIFFVVLMATDLGYYYDYIVAKISMVFFFLCIIFIINLMVPVRYDYIGTTKVNSKQIIKIADDGDGKKYVLKNGTSYVVYPNDVSHAYTRQKQTTYTFKRSQAELLPIRRLFIAEPVPERVKLEITKPMK